MHPSCSEYARRAVLKHGAAIGWMMAADRLTRCGRDELDRGRRIRVNGDIKFYDPVDENDAWFAGNGAGNGDVPPPEAFLPPAQPRKATPNGG